METYFFRNQSVFKDSHFGKEDINIDVDTGIQMFVEGKSAMFHGHPTIMQQLQKQMDAELTCIPYFSQTSEEAFVYMTPSLNIAFNKKPGKRSGETGYCAGCAGLYDFRRGAKADCGWKRRYFVEY